jgi:transglutaminase-like putative cysteine protease
MASFLIRHTTTYRYRQAVAFGEHRMMFRPRESHDQRTLDWHVAIEPPPQYVSWSEDAAGNLVGLTHFAHRARELRFSTTVRIEQSPTAPVEPDMAEYARSIPFSYGAEEMADLARFIERQHPDPEHKLDRWVRSILVEVGTRDGWSVDTWPFLERLNRTIWHDFAYLLREAKGIQSPLDTLRLNRGTCRDFAVLMCEAVRSQGFAARFVSGYLYVASHEPATQRAGGSTHAWLQIYLPGAGWIDFDPTSGMIGSEGLIRVAVVRDPERATPLSGSFTGFPSDYLGMSVEVSVIPLDEAAAPAGSASALPAELRPGATLSQVSTA